MANTLAQRTLPAPKQPVGDGAGPGAMGLRGRGLIPAPSDATGLWGDPPRGAEPQRLLLFCVMSLRCFSLP